MSAAWVAQIERGPPPPRRQGEDVRSRHGRHGLAPPGKAECDAIGRALGRREGEVWALAAPERMHALDEDVYAFHTAALAAVSGDLNDIERSHFESLRMLGQHADPAQVRAIVEGVDALAWMVSAGPDMADPTLAGDLADTFAILGRLRLGELRLLLRSFHAAASAVKYAGDIRAGGGPSAP